MKLSAILIALALSLAGGEEFDTAALFAEHQYYLERNLPRYKSYYNQNKDLEAEEIIKRVNCNLDKTFYEDTVPADLSKNELSLINKHHYLAKNYEPADMVDVKPVHGTGKLKKAAYEAFIEMHDDAKKEKLKLRISSSYRSFQLQKYLYNIFVNKDGQKKTDSYSSRPGYSEHQTGLAMDLMPTERNFKNTKEFAWLLENAHNYGFILRYPEDKEYITGYTYEPWHYRYVGTQAAKYIYDNNIAFEEYYEYFVKKEFCLAIPPGKLTIQ
jgi:D-alanyl-D-alanine carboxypeptidase